MRETDNAGIPAGIPQLAVRLSEEEAL
jgi:hypothetical protein